MKNKGQALVLFILLLPLIIIILSLIINSGTIYLEKKKTDTIIKEVIKETITNDLTEDEISKIIYKNLDNIDTLDIVKKDKTIEITIKKKIKIFIYKDNTYKVTFIGNEENIVRK